MFHYRRRLTVFPRSSVLQTPNYALEPLSIGTPVPASLQIENLLELGHGVVGALDRVANSAGVDVDLVVIAALKGLVAKEVDGVVLDAARLLGLVLEVGKAVGLVPAGGEDVKGDHAADGEAVLKGRPRLAGCFLPWKE